jgi:glutaredoxin 3
MAEPRYTLYQFDACPYCTAVRRRMGELGLTFTVVTVPHRREERTQVFAVSGQYLVPTLVVEEDGRRSVLTDENDILRFLDERYGPRPEPLSGGMPPEAKARLREAASDARRHADEIRRLALLARGAGDLDLGNVLTVAAINLLEASGWLGHSLEA